MKRPDHAKPPTHLTPSPPVPDPQAVEEDKLDPTRYGDWEKKGIAVDF